MLITLMLLMISGFSIGPASANEATTTSHLPPRMHSRVQNVVRCFTLLQIQGEATISADVIKVGPYFRERYPKQSFSNAIHLGTVKQDGTNIVILRPVGRLHGLRVNSSNPRILNGSSILFLSLSDEELSRFSNDISWVGSITVRFEFQEIDNDVESVRPSAIVPGSILNIEGRYYGVIATGAGTHEEQGVRPSRTIVFQLVEFARKPDPSAEAMVKTHALEFGGFWTAALDGRPVDRIVSLGKAILDVHTRIVPTTMNTVIATLVNWVTMDDGWSQRVTVPAIFVSNFVDDNKNP